MISLAPIDKCSFLCSTKRMNAIEDNRLVAHLVARNCRRSLVFWLIPSSFFHFFLEMAVYWRSVWERHDLVVCPSCPSGKRRNVRAASRIGRFYSTWACMRERVYVCEVAKKEVEWQQSWWVTSCLAWLTFPTAISLSLGAPLPPWRAIYPPFRPANIYLFISLGFCPGCRKEEEEKNIYFLLESAALLTLPVLSLFETIVWTK